MGLTTLLRRQLKVISVFVCADCSASEAGVFGIKECDARAYSSSTLFVRKA
jgi:hypothetical protein